MAAPHASDRRAVLAALGAIALWSTLAVLGLALRHLPPFLLVGCGLLLGSVWGVRDLGGQRLGPGGLALGIYGLFAYHLCLFLALRLAPPVEANLVNYLWPLLIVVLGPAFVPGASLHLPHVAGALAGFLGAALLVTGGGLGDTRGAALGYLLAFAAAVIWSTFSLATRRRGGFTARAIALFCAVSGVLALLCHVLFEPRVVPSLRDLPLLLAMGLGPLGLAFHLWDGALRHREPRVIGTLAYLTPLLSTLLIAVSGQGRLAPSALLGGTLIVGGAVIGTRAGPVAREPAP